MKSLVLAILFVLFVAVLFVGLVAPDAPANGQVLATTQRVEAQFNHPTNINVTAPCGGDGCANDLWQQICNATHCNEAPNYR